MTDFFTSDWHFNHHLLADLRGSRNTHEMNEWIIATHNSKVTKKDRVFVLGDVSMRGSPEYINKILTKLNGHLILIKGNHDDNRVLKRKRWEGIYDVLMLRTRDRNNKRVLIWLSHYAHLIWPQKHYGALHCYGHSHGKITNPIVGSMDVGIDTNIYLAPYSLEEILDKIGYYNALQNSTSNNRTT